MFIFIDKNIKYLEWNNFKRDIGLETNTNENNSHTSLLHILQCTMRIMWDDFCPTITVK